MVTEIGNCAWQICMIRHRRRYERDECYSERVYITGASCELPPQIFLPGVTQPTTSHNFPLPLGEELSSIPVVDTLGPSSPEILIYVP